MSFLNKLPQPEKGVQETGTDIGLVFIGRPKPLFPKLKNGLWTNYIKKSNPRYRGFFTFPGGVRQTLFSSLFESKSELWPVISLSTLISPGSILFRKRGFVPFLFSFWDGKRNARRVGAPILKVSFLAKLLDKWVLRARLSPAYERRKTDPRPTHR